MGQVMPNNLPFACIRWLGRCSASVRPQKKNGARTLTASITTAQSVRQEKPLAWSERGVC